MAGLFTKLYEQFGEADKKADIITKVMISISA